MTLARARIIKKAFPEGHSDAVTRPAPSLPMGATVVTLKVEANSMAPFTAGSSITEVTEMLITLARLRTA